MVVNVDFEAELYPAFHMRRPPDWQDADDERLIDIPDDLWDRYQQARAEVRKIAEAVALIKAAKEVVQH